MRHTRDQRGIGRRREIGREGFAARVGVPNRLIAQSRKYPGRPEWETCSHVNSASDALTRYDAQTSARTRRISVTPTAPRRIGREKTKNEK